jgi:hypothetical protein
VVFRPEQDVGGLDVAVHEPGRVGGVERTGDLRHDPRRPLRGERAVAAHEHTGVVAADEPHRQVRHARLLTGVIDRDDVRMLDRRRQLGLLEEPLARPVLAQQLGSDELERHRAVEAELRRAVHDTHPAPAHHRVDSMAGEYRPCRQLAHVRCI